MDAQGSGPGGRKDDEVCVNEDNPWLDEILDIETGLDNTVAGEITNVEGGKLDAVETDERTNEDGVTTEVEPRVESGKVGSKLKLTLCSSLESSSSSSSTQDGDVVGIWKELGVLASETSIEASNEVGVDDSTNGADGVDKGKGDNETEGTEGTG